MSKAPHSRRATVTTSRLAGLLVSLVATAGLAQELAPAAYTPAPYGVNLINVSSNYNSGDLAFDPSGPIDEASARITASILGYARTVKLAGRSANVSLFVPYLVGDLEGLYLGEPAQAHRSGLGDIAFRGAINLYGAPAMSPQEFSRYRARTLVGLSLVAKGPSGQYDSSKLINIGTNRWSFKPEVGVVRVVGSWAFDLYVGGWFYTDNTDFAGGLTRHQDPILSTQAHVRRSFSPRIWAALDANFWRGGRTALDGVANDDEQSNSRVGLTVAFRLDHGQSLRVAISRGAVTRIGGDFDSIGVSYGYSWRGKRRN